MLRLADRHLRGRVSLSIASVKAVSQPGARWRTLHTTGASARTGGPELLPTPCGYGEERTRKVRNRSWLKSGAGSQPSGVERRARISKPRSRTSSSSIR
jgi:hypothetical protein